MGYFTCPALGGVTSDPKDLCSERLNPENLCCFSCSKKPGCHEICMKIKLGNSSCGDWTD